MQKYFTKEISQSIKVIVLGLAIGLGVSFVSANWTAPLSTAPTCTSGNPGCDAPVNVSNTNQTKGGAGTPLAASKLNIEGLFTADTVGSYGGLWVGGVNAPTAENANNIFGKLTIDKMDLSQGPGRDMLEFHASSDNDMAGIRLNKPWFFLWDYAGNSLAGIRARNVQLTDGTEGNNKILASDAQGVSSWKTMRAETDVENTSTGQMIKYVKSGQGSGSQVVYCGTNAQGQTDPADDANWIAISGSGFCSDGIKQIVALSDRNNTNRLPGAAASTTTDPAIGYRIQCLTNVQVGPGKYVSGNGGGASSATAEAVCLRKTNLVTGVGVALVLDSNTPGNPGTPPSTVPAGYTEIFGLGTGTQACANNGNNASSGTGTFIGDKMAALGVSGWSMYNPHDFGWYTTDLNGGNMSAIHDRQCVFVSNNGGTHIVASQQGSGATPGISGNWLDTATAWNSLQGRPGYRPTGTITVGNLIYHVIAK